ncbi:MAG TPA: glycosyltransferase family 2 protein, partial [archaeon]|nr:glycosyltransferase family 2 protein [archaeon]
MPRPLPGISVIIPAHNEQATVARTLRAILSQRYPRFEVLLLADDCTDNTVPIAHALAKKDRHLRVLPNPARLGLAGSLNRGISLARYPLVCTLHADCVPRERTWLRSLATAVLADPRAGASTTAQLVPRSVFHKLTLSEKLLTVGSVQGGAKPRLLPPGQDVLTVNNKGDLYRKAALKAVGGFGSARFRVAGEDQDLSLRLRRAGWKLLLAPGLLLHLEGSHSRAAAAFFKKQLQYSEARGAMKR